MTKECPVILNNSATTVVKYGEVMVQFPSIHRDATTVFVKNDNGVYSIVDSMEPEVNKETVTSREQTTAKKKTINKNQKKRFAVSDNGR